MDWLITTSIWYYGFMNITPLLMGLVNNTLQYQNLIATCWNFMIEKLRGLQNLFFFLTVLGRAFLLKKTRISRPFDASINSTSYLWQDLCFMIMISSHLTKIKTCPVHVCIYTYVHKAYTPVDLCRTSRLLPVSFPSPILTSTYCTPSHCQRKGLLIIDIIRHGLETGRIRLLYNYSLVLDGGIKKKPSESTYYSTVSVCLIVSVSDVSIKLDHFRKSKPF